MKIGESPHQLLELVVSCILSVRVDVQDVHLGISARENSAVEFWMRNGSRKEINLHRLPDPDLFRQIRFQNRLTTLFLNHMNVPKSDISVGTRTIC